MVDHSLNDQIVTRQYRTSRTKQLTGIEVTIRSGAKLRYDFTKVELQSLAQSSRKHILDTRILDVIEAYYLRIYHEQAYLKSVLGDRELKPNHHAALDADCQFGRFRSMPLRQDAQIDLF